ncbi:MAG: tetratricopeptide repeat protein [Xenococcus sp. MO_188.B8]|nr:tetratricopeptide repeat protein [Xenococcus sp. MO_188.B8]
MNSEDKSENQKNINIEQGNYNEKIQGDYKDNSKHYHYEGIRVDEITGIPNNLPLFASNHFVGREEDLEHLHQLLQNNKTVAISGMGGIGKTELARQYALRYLEKYSGSICWLRARKDIGTQIVNFAVSSFKLNIPENSDLECQVQYCWNHWSKDNSLIVLDDVPNYGKYYQDNIQSYLYSVKQNFKVLITSRQKPGKNIEDFNLDVLSPEAALELLRSLSGASRIVCDLEQKKDYPSELCEGLGYLPLGLELVGRYLDLHPTDSIQEVIHQLEKNRLEAEALIHPEEADMTAQLGLAEAFELSWKELTTEAQELGCYLGLFSSEPFIWSWVEDGLLPEDLPENSRTTQKSIWKRISQNLISRLLKSDSQEINYQEQRPEKIKKLKNSKDIYLLKFNLLKKNSNQEDQQYQLHSLIQQYFRAKLETLGNSHKNKISLLQPLLSDFNWVIGQLFKRKSHEQTELLKQKFTQPMIVIAQSIPETPTQKDIKRVALAIPHLSNIATELIDYFRDENLIWLFEGLGRFYEGQGIYNQAEQWREKSLQTCRNRLGEEHLDVATSLNNLAELYYSQGRYSDAEPLYQEALDLRLKLLGKEHPDVATTLNDLAVLYQSQGRFSDAEPFYQEALDLRLKLLGEGHQDVAISLNNLAAFYVSQGQYSEAEHLYQQALELRKSQLSDKHPDVAQSLNNLAYLYTQQEKYSEAEHFYQQALELRKSQLSDKHPDVAQSLNNLAYLYTQQEKYTEAEHLYQQALDILKENFGKFHPSIANILNNQASLYTEQKRYGEAEHVYQQALEILEAKFGMRHPNIANILNNQGLIYANQDLYSKAKRYYQQALEILEENFGEFHPNIATTLNNLAEVHFYQKNYEYAAYYYSQALEMRKKYFGKNNPTNMIIYNKLTIVKKFLKNNFRRP